MAGWRPRDPYELLDDQVREQHLAGGVAAVEAIVHAQGVSVELQRKLLNVVTWYATEHPHKYRIRWRSAAAVKYRGQSFGKALRHEHVLPRKWLIDQLLARPDEAETILKSAVGCIVRTEESKRLDRVDKAIIGWERYRVAEIQVLDMGGDRQPMSIDEMKGLYPVPELDW